MCIIGKHFVIGKGKDLACISGQSGSHPVVFFVSSEGVTHLRLLMF